MRITDDRYQRDLRRIDLARRLIVHGARIGIVAQWTQLSPYRVRILYRDYGSGSLPRRGRPPQKASNFWTTAQRELEAATLAGICKLTDVLPRERIKIPQELPHPVRGERLCRAYESYLDSFDSPQICIDDAALLVTLLATTDEISMGKCIECSGIVLLDVQSIPDSHCVFCSGRIPGYHEAPTGNPESTGRRRARRHRGSSYQICEQVLLV